MTGMEAVIGLRRARLRPSAVFVNLVHRARRDDAPLSPQGIVTVDIGADESLTSLDLRPLVGLHVHVTDFTADRLRHRKVAAMVAAVDPYLLVMPVRQGDDVVVHRRFAGSPPRTETIRL